MTSRNSAVVQHHVGTRGSSEQKWARSVAAVGFHESTKRELKSSIEQTLCHLVFGGHKQRYVRWLQRRLEQFHLTTILQLEIRFEGAFANGARRIDRRQEANLIVSFGSVPFAQAFDMHVFGITTALAWSDQWVALRILLVKAHVTHRTVPHLHDRTVYSTVTIVSFQRILRVFWKQTLFKNS
jgi:hypothetical protein